MELANRLHVLVCEPSTEIFNARFVQVIVLRSTQSSHGLKCFPRNNMLEVETCEYLTLKESVIHFHGER